MAERGVPPGQVRAKVHPIERYLCCWALCTTRATRRVTGTHQEPIGEFCARHARLAARQDERAAWRIWDGEFGSPSGGSTGGLA